MTRYAPIWLPVAFFVRDVAAWVYVFSYEPAIPERPVLIHRFLLMPGVFFNVKWSFAFNIMFGLILGLAIRETAERHFPVWPWLLVLTWDVVLAGIAAFLSADGPGMLRLFRTGMLPGRRLSHYLFRWNLVTHDGWLLFIAITANVALAVLLTMLYRIFSPSSRELPPGSVRRSAI
jgi:hypothetical protein